MTKKILMGVSFLALLAAFPAFAETKVKAEASTETKIENTLDKAGDSIKNTADKAGDSIKDTTAKAKGAVKDAYSDMKGYFDDEKDVGAVTSVNVVSRLTADELIGTTVQNPKGEEIGKIQDILIDKEGDAETVIINDGGVLGLGGKLAAFDYDIIEGFSKDKDVVVKLSEEGLKKATAFDYEASTDAKIHTMPANMFSVAKIMDAKVVDANGKTVADVDTVAFDEDDADYLIVTFNKMLGMGGDKAALNMEALDMINNNGKYEFKLTSKQTAQFQNFKNATTKTY